VARATPRRSTIFRLLKAMLGIAIQILVSSIHAVGSTNVHSFSELEQYINSGSSSYFVAAEDITFPHVLEMYHGMTVSIESAIGATFSGGNATQLFYVDQSKLSLRSLTLAHGYCEMCFGGAITVRRGELTLKSVIISACQAQTGGAIYAVGSIVVAKECVLTANVADGSGNTSQGGAIVAMASSIIAADCTLTANSAAGAGGAIFLERRSTINTTKCVFSSNSAGGSGGVVATSGASVTATDCTMIRNFASAGGVLHASGEAVVSASACTMTSNSASFGGAVCSTDQSSITATKCEMANNRGRERGGAVYAEQGSTVVIAAECVLRSNSALAGGAIYARDEATFVSAVDCTMASNSADSGGTFHTQGWSFCVRNATLTATNCTLSSNLLVPHARLHRPGHHKLPRDVELCSSLRWCGLLRRQVHRLRDQLYTCIELCQ
jgi:predicted outer membrane repeat protein